ncbi:uncharacterized protein LOC111342641 [Stylophora pistillata]|uniref:uncharacterized protein LOC111342641 n=1 Tax=Stylophora pistillata TaxID=50429 RepID=UPI000C05794E|nr:uncharacterized protein LOC111342641 [Stylophora pistillata]
MKLSLNDLKHGRKTLERAPPPKTPTVIPTSQDDDNTGALSVASVRERFEQKRIPPQKPNATQSPSQGRGKPTEEKVLSVASARAKFEQELKPVNKGPHPWKPTPKYRNQSKTDLLRLDKNSNAKGHGNKEPPRKELPNIFRIGAAPSKPAKPTNLRFMLKKYKDKIILSNSLTSSTQTSTKADTPVIDTSWNVHQQVRRLLELLPSRALNTEALLRPSLRLLLRTSEEIRVLASTPTISEPSKENPLLRFEHYKETSITSPPSWKQNEGNQKKTGSQRRDGWIYLIDQGNTEPNRKELPTLCDIGAAPQKPARPDYLKFNLRKYWHMIAISKGVRNIAKTSSGSKSNEGAGYLDLEENCDYGAAEPPMITRNVTRLTPGEAEDSKDATASKVITDKGVSLSVKGVNLICPPGAVKDPVSIRLTLEEPYRYCYLIARCGLHNDVLFVSPIVNCRPNGQKFEKYVTLKVTLNRKRVKSDGDLLVLHGTRTGQSQIINWEDITNESKFDLQTKNLEVRINQFSLIAVLARLTLVRTKEIVTRLNLMPFNYNLSVLLKLNKQQSPFDELALVFMSQDTYREEYYRDHEDSAIMRLKKDGFEELPIDSKNAQESICIYNKEIITISVQLGEDYKPANNQQECFEVVVDSCAWWNTGHVIKLPLQVCNTNSKIVCGKILVKGEFGHVRENKFCQQDLCGYVRHVLGVKKAIFDVKAVAQKLELPAETQRQVLTCWQSEAKQLELVLLHWREKHGDAANPNHLKKALEELEPEEYKVKERGQMHIDHLRELAFKIAGLEHHDTDVMKYFDREVEKLCSAVLRDCCIENATSKEEVESAIQTENFASVLVMKKRLPESVGKTCTRMFSSQEDEFNTSSFLCVVSELIQCIKEIFREEKIQRTLSGLRGVTEEATLQKITSGIRDAAYDKSIFKLLSEVCHILEILCRNNNDDRQRESRIQSWGSCAMMAVMLHFLERFFQCAEACRLYRRLKLFSFSIRDIMSNPTAYEGSFLRDFHNVAVSLLKFARFDPSHLVQFELKDPNYSINNQTKDDIKYDTSKEMFSQLFWMIKKCEENLQLEATAHVHVGGQLLTLGAFEAMVILPESFSEVVENAPIASFPVSFKSETDGESSNLRVTLYSTQKDNIGKALEYLQDALDGQLSLSKQTEIKETSLKLLNVAKAGTDVRLRLTHIWGSGTLGVESNTFVPLGYSSPETHNNLEITDEPDQQAVGESSLLPVAGTSEYIADNHNRGNDFMTGPSSAELIPSLTSTTRQTVINVNNYINHTVNMEGHVCVAGERPNLNVQSPSSAAHRFLEAGPGAATNRSITAGDI